MSETTRGVHDVGGLDFGPVHRAEHAQTLYEKRVDALVMLMTSPRIGAFKVDALRRMIETNSAEDYASLGYYDKWIRAVRDLLIELQIVSPEELSAKMADVRARMQEAGHA